MHEKTESFVYEYPRAANTADMVVLSPAHSHVLLIRRQAEPFKDCWALPGGFWNPGETLEQTAIRELQEETGLVVASAVQVGTFSTPGRDPRGDVITTAFLASADKDVALQAGDDAAEAKWWHCLDLPPLAFDHGQIMAAAISRYDQDCFAAPFVLSKEGIRQILDVLENPPPPTPALIELMRNSAKQDTNSIPR